MKEDNNKAVEPKPFACPVCQGRIKLVTIREVIKEEEVNPSNGQLRVLVEGEDNGQVWDELRCGECDMSWEASRGREGEILPLNRATSGKGN